MGEGYTHLAPPAAAALCLAAREDVAARKQQRRRSADRKTHEARGGLGWVRSMPSPLVLSREAVSCAERRLGSFAMAPGAREHVLQLAMQIEEKFGAFRTRGKTCSAARF